ncbi:MAG: zf-TFIIB domain-containing protein, partial [Elusimicrobiales bacterium]|nr:zf-TFIIB domain-containing protein [Elusimicrobiales bacterium]
MTKCPKCDSETLVKTEELGNIPLDVCPGCKGIWFDKGELAEMAVSVSDLCLGCQPHIPNCFLNSVFRLVE